MFNKKIGRLGEVPSSGTHATARSLARLAAFMAHKGQLNGQRIFSEQTWNEIHSCPKTLSEGHMTFGIRTTYTKGGFNLFGKDKFTNHEQNRTTQFDLEGLTVECEERFHGERNGYIGWQGFGGSLV